MTVTPIAVFTYNRAEHTERVLKSLANCARLDECLLHIYCDGPKSENQAPSVEASRKVVREHATRLGAHVIERNTNVGLARSVVDGVTDLCSRFGRVIVVEDDLVLNAAFIDYMLQSLDRYAEAANVYQISGYMFPVSQPASPDAFFLPLITTWGWATWARAWKVFDWDTSDATERLRDAATRRSFNLNGVYPYAEMLEATLQGEHDSWGILFWWAVFKAGGLVLHPRKSLVWNGGTDATGTHRGNQLWANQSLSEFAADEWSADGFVMPEKVTVDEAAFAKVVQHLKSEHSSGGLFERIRRRIVVAQPHAASNGRSRRPRRRQRCVILGA